MSTLLLGPTRWAREFVPIYESLPTRDEHTGAEAGVAPVISPLEIRRLLVRDLGEAGVRAVQIACLA